MPTEDDERFRAQLFQSLTEEPLTPDDARYEVLYEGNQDVVALIHEGIRFSRPEGVQLLSGYRGSGKSTELRRLERRLTEEGYLVVLIDIEEYLDLDSPLDVTDFLLGLSGALGERFERPELLGQDGLREGAWTRLWHWMNSELDVRDLSLSVKPKNVGASLKLEFRDNPTFRMRLQAVLKNSLGAFKQKVDQYIEDNVNALKKRHGADRQLVVLVDSIEHARGTRENEEAVHAALERLFVEHSETLQLPQVHLVYTVPPWLRIRHPGVGGYYTPGQLYVLPAQNVFARPAKNDVHQTDNKTCVDRIVSLVAKRGDWTRLLGGRDALERLIRISGGHLRDLIRLLRSVVLHTRAGLPATDAVLDDVIGRFRTEYLPIANEDARWLAEVARNHDAGLDTYGQVPGLARFFDTHLVLCYRNGEEWFDVHPVIRDVILEQAERAAGRTHGIR